jgi:hypothetical protein
MTTSDRIVLDKVGVGDFLHAEYPNGAKAICLTLEVTTNRIWARDITRQEKLEFDRRTGVSISKAGDVECSIFSTEPLPPELHEALVGLDRKYGSGRVPTEEESKLTPAEFKALILIRP